jgi:hypothetical protein
MLMTRDTATECVEAHKVQGMTSAPMKWIYSEDHAECLNRMIQYVLITNGSKRTEDRENRFAALLSALNFGVRYPDIQLDRIKLMEHFRDESKKFDTRKRKKGKVYSLNTTLFVLEKEIAEVIPSAALAVNSTPITPIEAAYILKTINTLIHRRLATCKKLGFDRSKPVYRKTPHSYFLGDYYHRTGKSEMAAIAKCETKEQAYIRGLEAGKRLALAGQVKQNTYRQEYRLATGSRIYVEKLTKIIQALAAYDFVKIRRVRSKKFADSYVNAYAFGERSKITNTNEWKGNE